MADPLTAYRVNVTSTPIKLLDCAVGRGKSAFIRNASGTQVFLGGAGVTVNDGFLVPANTTIGPLLAWPGGDLRAVRSGAGTSVVHVLVS